MTMLTQVNLYCAKAVGRVRVVAPATVAGIAQTLKQEERDDLAKGMLDYASTLLEDIRGERDRASVVADVGQALAEDNWGAE